MLTPTADDPQPIETEDDGYWDDWDIAVPPDGRSGPIRTAGGLSGHRGRGGQIEVDYTLAREILALRTLLEQVIRGASVVESAAELVSPVTRLVDAIARALRAHAALTGGPDNPISRTLNHILDEIGLEEERIRAQGGDTADPAQWWRDKDWGAGG
jgi:hypothetical protein